MRESGESSVEALSPIIGISSLMAMSLVSYCPNDARPKEGGPSMIFSLRYGSC